MDIWQWVFDTQKQLVEQGNYRLAHLMNLVSHNTVEENHAQVDAIVPEALALARAAKNPWLEVFIRHWNLQSRVAHRSDIKNMLPEAVSALEFANRDDTRDCPQSICTVQDLTICYDKADGPGYVEERLSVAKEALDKIDHSWACFTCISGEYASALLDGKRYEEALKFLEQQAQTLLSTNQYDARFHMRGTWVEILIQLQRYEEAQAFNQEAKEHCNSQARRLSRDIDEARIAIFLGRYEEAKQVLPDFDTIEPTPSHYLSFAEAMQLLAKADQIPNDWQLNAKLQWMSEQLSQQGVIRKAFTMALWQAELALKRGQPITANRCRERAESLIPDLRQPLDAPELLANLRAQITSAFASQSESPLAFETPEQVLEYVETSSENDPESAITLLETARQRWPNYEDITFTMAGAYQAIGEHQYSMTLLRQYLEEYPDSPQTVLAYGTFLLEEGSAKELENFTTDLLRGKEKGERRKELSEQVQLNCHWLLALQYTKQEEFEAAKQQLSILLARNPYASNAKTLLARLERKTGDLQAALQHLDELVEQLEEADQYDWERIIVATLLEDWDKVRHSADRLGFENLPTEGPIEQEWGLCRIQFQDKKGEPINYYAMRTGPVTATILEISAPDNEQHYNDKLVFAPIPINNPPPPDETEPKSEEEMKQRMENIPIYVPIQITKAGGYACYLLGGVYPGKAAFQNLESALENIDCRCQVQSDDTYQISQGNNSEPLMGLFAYLAVPEQQSLQTVADLLATSTSSYPHPLIWPEIVEKLGDTAELERQKRIMEEYRL
jgi:thioredoxin-like negative regulator of GroEL